MWRVTILLSTRHQAISEGVGGMRILEAWKTFIQETLRKGRSFVGWKCRSFNTLITSRNRQIMRPVYSPHRFIINHNLASRKRMQIFQKSSGFRTRQSRNYSPTNSENVLFESIKRLNERDKFNSLHYLYKNVTSITSLLSTTLFQEKHRLLFRIPFRLRETPTQQEKPPSQETH